MIKQCKICGKKFDAKNPNYKTCSTECSKANATALRNQWKEENSHKLNEYYLRYLKKARHPWICRICGSPVDGSYHHYHDECVIREALEDIRAGIKSTKSDKIKRAKNTYGYTVGELKAMIND